MINGNILTKLVEEEKKTTSGIYIPTTVEKHYKALEVVSFDESRIEDLSIGDVIYTSKTGGVKIDHDGDDFIIVHQNDVILIE